MLREENPRIERQGLAETHSHAQAGAAPRIGCVRSVAPMPTSSAIFHAAAQFRQHIVDLERQRQREVLLHRQLVDESDALAEDAESIEQANPCVEVSYVVGAEPNTSTSPASGKVAAVIRFTSKLSRRPIESEKRHCLAWSQREVIDAQRAQRPIRFADSCEPQSQARPNSCDHRGDAPRWTEPRAVSGGG